MESRKVDLRKFFPAATTAATNVESVIEEHDAITIGDEDAVIEPKHGAGVISSTYSPLPGFTIVHDALTPAQEAAALDAIASSPWDDKSLKRRVQHYGYVYAYKSPKLEAAPVIPDWARALEDTCAAAGLHCSVPPDQVIVNEYVPGQGIAAHVDHEGLFGDYVLAVSLGSTCVMKMQHKVTGRIVNVTVPRRSAYKMEEEARYQWTHAIVGRASDKIDGVVRPRGTRISVTYRCRRPT